MMVWRHRRNPLRTRKVYVLRFKHAGRDARLGHGGLQRPPQRNGQPGLVPDHYPCLRHPGRRVGHAATQRQAAHGQPPALVVHRRADWHCDHAVQPVRLRPHQRFSHAGPGPAGGEPGQPGG